MRSKLLSPGKSLSHSRGLVGADSAILLDVDVLVGLECLNLVIGERDTVALVSILARGQNAQLKRK